MDRRPFQARRTVLAVFFIFATGILSSCSLPWSGDETSHNWRDDVLMASECGMDGLQCCIDKEPRCLYGQECCVDPIDPSRTYCADSCECGKEGAFCCAGNNSCGPGLACSGHRCRSCGGEGEPVCLSPEEPCQPEFVPYQGKCLECGLTGNPCCQADPACQDIQVMAEGHAECVDGVCRECGTHNKVMCPASGCLAGYLANSGKCFQCGHKNDACCAQEFAESGGCDPAEGLFCEKGFCSQGSED